MHELRHNVLSINVTTWKEKVVNAWQVQAQVPTIAKHRVSAGKIWMFHFVTDVHYRGQGHGPSGFAHLLQN